MSFSIYSSLVFASLFFSGQLFSFEIKPVKFRSEVLSKDISTHQNFLVRIIVDTPYKETLKADYPLPEIIPNIPEGFYHISSKKTQREIAPMIKGHNVSFVVRYSRILIFKAIKKGRFNVSFAKLKSKNGEIAAAPVEVRISANHLSHNLPTEPGAIRFSYTVSTKSPYVGQYVKAILKLYLPRTHTKVNMDFLDPPASDKAFVKTYYTYSDKSPRRKSFPDGLEVTLEELLVYPLESGEITISPRKLELSDGTTRVVYQHDPIILNAKATGELLNGDFRAETEVSPTEITPDSTVVYSLIISGSGNLVTFEFPKSLASSMFDKLAHLEHTNTQTDFEWISDDLSNARKSIHFTLKIRKSGLLPSTTIQYFNTQLGKNMHLVFTPPEFNIISGVKNHPVSFLSLRALVLKKHLLAGGVLATLLLAFLIFVIRIIKKKRRKSPVEDSKDIHASRSSNIIAVEKILAEIETDLSLPNSKELSAGNIDSAYRKMLIALAELFNLDPENLSHSSLIREMRKRKIEQSPAETAIGLLKRIQTIRFSSQQFITKKEEVENDLAILKKLCQRQ